jgi:hypothetical protein
MYTRFGVRAKQFHLHRQLQRGLQSLVEYLIKRRIRRQKLEAEDITSDTMSLMNFMLNLDFRIKRPIIQSISPDICNSNDGDDSSLDDNEILSKFRQNKNSSISIISSSHTTPNGKISKYISSNSSNPSNTPPHHTLTYVASMTPHNIRSQYHNFLHAAFKRLYHRTICVSREIKITQSRKRRVAKRCFDLWRNRYLHILHICHKHCMTVQLKKAISYWIGYTVDMYNQRNKRTLGCKYSKIKATST